MDFQSEVGLKYQIYNSLFLNLPFAGIEETGTLLPLFAQEARAGLAKKQAPREIVETFFREYAEELTAENRIGLLFRFIQYVERQVVLFDAAEDAAFAETHDVDGKGSIKNLLDRTDSAHFRGKLLEKIATFSVRLVLTAHPTQFYPGKVLGIINDLGTAIHENKTTEIRALLMQLGKTAFVNQTRPTPYDEAISLGWFLENVFYTAMPDSIFRLLKGVGADPTTFAHPSLLTLGFWPGGDRDGNPFVVTETTHLVATRLREGILRCYYREIRQLKRRLTFAGVEEIINESEQKINNTLYYPTKSSYLSANELLADLQRARQVLIEKHQSLFIDLLDIFILKIRIFGFHFASLDIRQNVEKHDEVWKSILQKTEEKIPAIFSQKNYETWDENQKIDFLLTLKGRLDEADYADEMVKETIRCTKSIAEIQAENGEMGCHRYIISGCGKAVQIAETLALARLCLLKKDEKTVNLDIVPLFETIEDLAESGNVMQKLYQNPHYAEHLLARDQVQHIMLGFSDGTKDGGYLRANWSIYRAKELLTKVSRAAGVSVIFFDGRGGPPGRGGGNNASYYAAHGPEIENREIHVTIQGQTVSSTYGTVQAATYNIERLFTAGLETAVFGGEHFEEKQKKTADLLAESAYQAYLGLKNHENFVPYLEKMTPLKWYGQTNIASRPTRRGDGKMRFEDLRAIPFVGAWAQMKQNVPGFYGFGSALENWQNQGKTADLRALFSHSLFFRTLVENSMQSLSKSNFDLTRYIATDPQFGDFWQMIADEFERTKTQIGLLTEKIDLLASRESIELRENIVLPLIVIQQCALQKLEEPNLSIAEREIYSKIVTRAMFGIINAARNSA
jgi:phosphoenolpyruvate carboxylase